MFCDPVQSSPLLPLSTFWSGSCLLNISLNQTRVVGSVIADAKYFRGGNMAWFMRHFLKESESFETLALKRFGLSKNTSFKSKSFD